MDLPSCPYAHTPNAQLGQWHGLEDHLRGTAELAAEFGAAFGRSEDCRVAGLWHDIGKASPDFQEYLAACAEGRAHPGADHKCAGALLAQQRGRGDIAMVILGHHGGIPNKSEAMDALKQANADQRPQFRAALAWAETDVASAAVPPLVRATDPPSGDLVLRLMYSALVDADFLDTEHHFEASRAGARRSAELLPTADLVEVEARAHEAFLADRNERTKVDGVRRAIREAALSCAAAPPGLFRLTVPTGGGKTRSALAFALRHAALHGLRRVVTAMPYLTITDQTASVYREALAAAGDGVILEQHSAIDLERTTVDPKLRMWHRLAAENWDAPIVVTTTLQLFESLFSNRSSRLRKAHRLARSVIILDEAQALRLSLLGVTADMIGALVYAAGASVVLCTATQPALDAISPMVGHLTEIVPDYRDHFAALQRVAFDVPARTDPEPWTWERVASQMSAVPQSLAIVNRRSDALALVELLGPNALHLSTLLCAAHRENVLREVRERLTAGRPVRLVATQVVEAGVDIDFPLVLRALAPYDSVAQAAGRCNREGRLRTAAGEPMLGRCIVFTPPEEDCFDEYQVGRDELRGLFQEGRIDFDDPDDCRRYFERRYGHGQLQSVRVDPKGLRMDVRNSRFRDTAEKYRLIEDATSALIVRYAREAEVIAKLLDDLGAARSPGAARHEMRRLQRYTVSVYTKHLDRARRRGLVEQVGGVDVWKGVYDDRVGIAELLAETGQERDTII